MKQLKKDTVTELLWNTLITLMDLEPLHSFRLVGGTALSLQLGHRISIDIDLFTGLEYGTVDFINILNELNDNFDHIDIPVKWVNNTMGNSCYVGESGRDLIKIDLFYTDTFIMPPLIFGNVRLAQIGEIAAMKIDAICNRGRKKDFWDLHKLLETLTIDYIINLYEKRHPYELPTLKHANSYQLLYFQ